MDLVRVAGVIGESIVDGPGIRYVIFTQGCRHNCEGCHNPHTHSFEGGSLVDIYELLKEIEQNPLIDGITLSGGEPFEQAEVLSKLAREVKHRGYNVITYTGYTYEYLYNNCNDLNKWGELLNCTDILVDGKFELSRKNLRLKFRGSENQRIIDVEESRASNKVVELEL